MAKLTGAKKSAFLKRMRLGRLKASRKSNNPRSSSRIKRSKTHRKSQPLRRKPSRHSPMPKRRRSRRRASVSSGFRRAKSGIGNIFKSGIIKNVSAGIGAGVITGLVVGAVAPQFSGIAKPVGALLAGGPVGAIASILLDGGLGSFGSIFGGGVKQELSV